MIFCTLEILIHFHNSIFFSALYFIVVTGATDGIGKAYAEAVSFKLRYLSPTPNTDSMYSFSADLFWNCLPL